MQSERFPIFYINLASRPDRRHYMEDQLARLGLVAERIEAVPASGISDEELERFRRPWGYTMSRTEVACSLSHQAAWREIASRRLPLALILEDDAVLSDQLPAFLADLGPTLPPGVDVLKVETDAQPVRLSLRPPVRFGAYSLRRLVGTHHGTCGYLLGPAMAETALRDDARLEHPVDMYLFSRYGPVLYRHSVYQLDPALCIQRMRVTEDAVTRSDMRGTRADGKQRRTFRARLHRSARLIRAAAMELIHFHSDYRAFRAPNKAVTFAGESSPTAPGPAP